MAGVCAPTAGAGAPGAAAPVDALPPAAAAPVDALPSTAAPSSPPPPESATPRCIVTAFRRPYLAPGCAVFADFFGLASIVPTLPVFLLAWASSQGVVGDEGAQWARRWVGAILTAQSFAKMPGHLFWGVQSAKLGSRKALTVVMLLNVTFFAVTALFSIDGIPLGAVAALLAVRLLAGFAVPTVPAFVFLFDRQEPGPALVASIGKFGGFILSGLTLGGAAVAVPFGEPFAIWGGVMGLSTAIALLALLPVYFAPPVLDNIVAMRKNKPEGIRRALATRARSYCSGLVSSSLRLSLVSSPSPLPLLSSLLSTHSPCDPLRRGRRPTCLRATGVHLARADVVCERLDGGHPGSAARRPLRALLRLQSARHRRVRDRTPAA